MPVQAVYAHGPELTYCFVMTPEGWEQREVQVGPTNDSDVIIEQGLAENDKVSLESACPPGRSRIAATQRRSSCSRPSAADHGSMRRPPVK